MGTDGDAEVTILTNGTLPDSEAAGAAFLAVLDYETPAESYVKDEGQFYCWFRDVGNGYFVKEAADKFCARYGATIRVDATDNDFDETDITFHGAIDPAEVAKSRRRDLDDVVSKITFVRYYIPKIGLGRADEARLVRKYEDFVADLERTAKAMDKK